MGDHLLERSKLLGKFLKASSPVEIGKSDDHRFSFRFRSGMPDRFLQLIFRNIYGRLHAVKFSSGWIPKQVKVGFIRG